MKKIKKLAITGANGYLGVHTIKIAIKNNWAVNAVIRREEVINDINELGATPFIVKDFEIESLKKAFIGCKAVIHFANVVCGSKEVFQTINVNGMRNIIKASLETDIKRIIYPSGLGVDKYGKYEWATNEYFKSKKIAEQLLIDGKVPYIIFRPSYILGPKDELIPEIINQIINGVILIAGKGDIPMQPIYINDAIRAFLAAAEGIGDNNKIYELVGPKITNMIELTDFIYQKLIKHGFNIPPPKKEFIPYEAAPLKLNICKEMVDVMKCDLTVDYTKTPQALGFDLSSLDEAIEAAVTEKLFPKIDSNNKKAIILLSGGLDSTVALYWALNQQYDLFAITINYTNRPRKEINATKEITDLCKVKLLELPLSFLKDAIDLRCEGFPIPSAINAPEGYIPLRNLIFYSIAAYFAEALACKYIIGGHISTDSKLFSDANESFFQSVEKMVNQSKHPKDKNFIKFIFPLISMDKNDVAQLANKLNVPIELTWSCYHDFDQPCGNCSSCKNREKALNQNK